MWARLSIMTNMSHDEHKDWRRLVSLEDLLS